MSITRRQLMATTLGATAITVLSDRAVGAATGHRHIVLLGDSIFDNKVYVGDDPAVIDQLRKNIPDGWQATLLAVDGSITADIAGQLEPAPEPDTSGH